jgi:hypothetical protein
MFSLPLFDSINSKKKWLKDVGVSHCFKETSEYDKRISRFQKVVNFPWREDQNAVIEKFMENKNKYYVINGIFGCGKTTLLFGLLINSILKKVYKPEDVLFISFNVCIKNELERKLREFGFKNKISVRTFDSIIYSICKINDYPYLDFPNYDGKRRFCYDIVDPKPLEMTQPKIIFIDEVQDLENKTISIFNKFFPESKIVFAGDIFQSIQKEPRESLLWHLLHNFKQPISKFYMKITPRVPKNILGLLQNSLKTYYPEFTSEIDTWKSTNEISMKNVEWNRFYSYSNIHNIITEFVDTKGPENSMVLTFSSAITVKGAMGDVARLRNYLQGVNVHVNNNHKKIEEDKLFLSTANSSKGLERDHVLVILTFPLERAFINFSDDLVMNLITVAITRAKKSVKFYVPAYEDKFSRVLTNYTSCPQPNKKRIREGKTIKEFTWQDFLDMEQGVTELIRQNIILYDTRLKLKESVKMYETGKLFDDLPPKKPTMFTEEDRAAVGVLIENLITSTWSGRWPLLDNIDKLKNHPMYSHIISKIEKKCLEYSKFIKNGNIHDVSTQFKGMYMYTQLHVSVYNKMLINFSTSSLKVLENYWKELKPIISTIKPSGFNLNIQNNLRMPWLTGIADVVFNKKNENGKSEVHVWELKASVDVNWKDDALTQALLYTLMTGKSWGRITLLNPFRNEKCSFHFLIRLEMKNAHFISMVKKSWNYVI